MLKISVLFAALMPFAIAIANYSLVEVGYDFLDHDIGNAQGKNIEDCFTQCASDKISGCAAVTFTNFNGGTCWFKSARGDVKVNAGANSTAVYSTPPSVGVYKENTDIVGNDLTSKKALATECLGICQAYPGCRAFSWNNYQGGTCWLKSKRTIVSSKSGVKSADAYPNAVSDIVLQENTDFPEHDIGNVSSPSPEDCVVKCQAKPHCRAVSWSNYQGGTCWFKGTDFLLRPDYNYVDSAGFCQLRCAQNLEWCVGSTFDEATKTCTLYSWSVHPKTKLGVTSASVRALKRVFKFVYSTDIAGNDISHVTGIANMYDCPGVCEDTAGCNAFSWSNATGGTCWLKKTRAPMTANNGVSSAYIIR